MKLLNVKTECCDNGEDDDMGILWHSMMLCWTDRAAIVGSQAIEKRWKRSE